MIFAWADVDVDLEKFAGATDFQGGSAFGRAAVDAVNGNGTWDNDFVRRQMTSPPGFGSDVYEEETSSEGWKFEAPASLVDDAAAARDVDWATLRGVRDAHALPRTWRGEAD